MNSLSKLCCLLLSVFSCLTPSVYATTTLQPIPISKIEHAGAVDFEKEVLPILKQNCLACHNQTKAKGSLILETPQSMIKGGDTGPGVLPDKSAESLILRAAAHLDPDLEMPPPDNKVAANPLTPEELGLLRLWIEQGAKGEVRGLGPIDWQPLPPQLNAIFALALSSDGHFVACGRGNRIFVYDLVCSRLAGELTDESLNTSRGRPEAHRDTVNALAFSPDGESLASGGYREIKIWRGFKSPPKLGFPVESSTTNGIDSTVIISSNTVKFTKNKDSKPVFEVAFGSTPSAVALRPDGKFIAAAIGTGVRLWRVSDSKQVAEIKGDGRLTAAVIAQEQEITFARSEVEFRKAALKRFETNHAEILDRQKRANEADIANTKLLVEKQLARTNALSLERDSLKALNEFGPEVGKLVEQFLRAEQDSKSPDKSVMQAATNLLAETKSLLDKLPAETKEKRKAVTEKLIAARKAIIDADNALKPVQITKLAGEHELKLASEAVQKSKDSEPLIRGGIDRAIRELANAESDLTIARKNSAESEKPFTNIIFSPDNSLLITADESGTLRAWSAESGAFYSVVTKTVSSLNTVFFDSAGRLVVVANGQTVAWDLNPKWKLERTIGTGNDDSPLADRVNALRFSANGKFLISGGGEPSRDGEIKVWHTRTGRLVREFKNVHSDSVVALDLSPDGKYLASGSADRFARVLDFETGKVLKNLEGHTHHVLGVAWKHDERTLFTAGADGVAKTWDFVSSERRKNVEGFGKEVTSVGFIGLSNQALLTSGDGQIQIVDDQGKKIRSMSGSTDYVYTAAATADGLTIVAGGLDGTLRIWNGADGKLVNEFRAPKP
ncbi:MAG: Planctomycete cytochrome [Verrucomicrobiales bacterium]|nr:Planctomycete cytochrome [Verrucomicrobiales bacterium]